MNKLYTLIKPAAVLGAIIGAIFGIVTLIPFIQCLTCFAIVFIGAGVVFYLKRNAFVGILSIQDGALIGGISGFTALVAASIIFLPVTYIISLFSSHLPKTEINLTSSIMATSYILFILPMFVFFLALLSALFNAFSGLVVAYIYEKIENNPMKDEGGIDIEQ